MREMIVSELMQAMQELSRGFAHILPRIIVLVIVALLGWVVAYLLKILLRSFLRLIKFDKLSESAGASQLLSKAALPSATELLSRFVFWVAWLGFILLGISVLGVFGLQEQIAKFFLFLPRLFAAFLTMFGRLLSVSIRTIIIIFVLSMVFEEVGVAEETVLVAFGIAFGALMLGLAIAFGMGGKDLAQHFLEKRFGQKRKDEEKEDELSPL
jgi:hypothetical protein